MAPLITDEGIQTDLLMRLLIAFMAKELHEFGDIPDDAYKDYVRKTYITTTDLYESMKVPIKKEDK